MVTKPVWRYAAHYEAEQKRIHYIEVARDDFHFGIERHTLTSPAQVGRRVWFEYEGIYCPDFSTALHQRVSTRKDDKDARK